MELGRLADHNGQSQDTRQFGQRMVNDHSKANEQLKELAAAASIPLPNAPGPEDEAIRERLDKMQGDAFDRDYIRSQVTAHQETVQLFEYEIGTGQDSQLKNFASQTLPAGAARFRGSAARQLGCSSGATRGRAPYLARSLR